MVVIQNMRAVLIKPFESGATPEIAGYLRGGCRQPADRHGSSPHYGSFAETNHAKPIGTDIHSARILRGGNCSSVVGQRQVGRAGAQPQAVAP